MVQAGCLWPIAALLFAQDRMLLNVRCWRKQTFQARADLTLSVRSDADYYT